MFRSAIVGVDLSPAQEALLSCLPALERWGVTRLVLVHVIRIGFGQGAGYGHEHEFRDWLEGHAAPLRARGFAVDVVVTASGSVSATLLEVAAERDAELLMVGSRSHNLVRKVFLGSVTREVIRQANLPVLIQRIEPVPESDPARCDAICRETLDRVLLVTDFSQQSAAAEAAAISLAPKAGRVDCLHVACDLDAITKQRGQALAGRLAAAGTQATARFETGKTDEAIARIGSDGYTLIVIGKHGQGWVEGAILGSTAARVCETAALPVLLVPVPA
jgi:nucleotide-binding universal stress UspA family protein